MLKNPANMSREELLAIVTKIQGILWLDLGGEDAPKPNAEWWNPDKGWDCDKLQDISEELVAHDLRPDLPGEEMEAEKKGGACPLCGGELDYDAGSIEEEAIKRPVGCLKCGWQGNEWESTYFSDHLNADGSAPKK